MGWENVFQVEIDSFCQKVLEKNFPNVKRYGDIKEFNGTKYRGAIDVLSGGFPCQPFSMAGKRKGNKDDRYLWPEMLRVIRQIQPAFIVGENVYGLVNWSQGLVFEQVCSDLENEGFQVQPVILPACAVDAPHRRDRVWFVAHSEENGNSRGLPAIQSKDGCIRKPKEHWENHMQSSDNGTQRDVANTFKKRPTGGGVTMERKLQRQQRSKRGLSLSENFSIPGKTSRLNHRFVIEMMGYPPGWCDLEQKPEATPSSRKSRSKSSKQ